MQVSGGAVREHRARAAGENRGHVTPADRQQLAWDQRVDASMDPVQLAGGRPLLNCASAEAERFELRKGDHPLLAERKLDRTALAAKASI